MKYIHYGHKSFEENKFDSPQNIPYRNKPTGGLWGSPVDAVLGWREWCEAESYSDCKESNSFVFELKDTANVLVIKSMDNVSKLTTTKESVDCMKAFDFEKMLADGIDAILFLVSECRELYMEMYGWDCDSILVLNKNVIVIKEELSYENQ